jgi:protein-ribulosamine 3-kinase
VRGEYTSMTAISQALPDFCPVPIAVGTYASDPSVHFFLMSFVDMTDEVPEPDSLAAKLAELHVKGTSPNGKFGFPVPTNTGALTHPNAWTSSWETFFSSLMRRNFQWEQQMHGHHEEMKQLFDALVAKVIPRLLRPLETGGNEITPCIVHGDLWDGNASTDASTDKPIIFDASSMYAHNECAGSSSRNTEDLLTRTDELGAWNLPRHQIYKMYIRAYQRHFPISSPEEDCDDRLLLYCL